MPKLFILFFILFMLLLCNTKKQFKSGTTSSVARQDSFAPLQVTILGDLPDLLQPKTILLDSMPKPITIAVTKAKGGFYSITNSKGKGKVKMYFVDTPI